MKLESLTTDIFAGRAIVAPLEGESRPVIALRDVTTRIKAVDALQAVTASPAEVRKLSVLAGDVLVTARGSTRAAVAKVEHEGALAGANLIVIRLDGRLPPELLAAYLRHPTIQATLKADFAGTTTVGFSVESLKKLELRGVSEPEATILSQFVEANDAYAEHLRSAARLRQDASAQAVFDRMSADRSKVAT